MLCSIEVYAKNMSLAPCGWLSGCRGMCNYEGSSVSLEPFSTRSAGNSWPSRPIPGDSLSTTLIFCDTSTWYQIFCDTSFCDTFNFCIFLWYYFLWYFIFCDFFVIPILWYFVLWYLFLWYFSGITKKMGVSQKKNHWVNLTLRRAENAFFEG